MTRNKRERRRGKHSEPAEPQAESNLWRRIGAGLTLVVVCTLTVVAGYYVGQYVIRSVVQDTLGDTPHLADANGGALRADLAGSPSAQPAASQGTAVDGPLTATQLTGVRTDRTYQSEAASETTVDTPNNTTVQASGTSTEASASRQGNDAVPAVSRGQVETSPTRYLHRVQVGGYGERSGAEALLRELSGEFPDAFIVFGTDYRVQVGSFSSEAGAREVADKLRAQGHADVHIEKVEL